MPGLGLKEGEYILADDGVRLRALTNPDRLLENTSGRSITVTVSTSPSAENARKVIVEPVEDEEFLGMWEWVMHHQSRVDEWSGGRLGYVWLPNTSRRGYEFFHRMYFAQQNREGAIIDSRDNGGGVFADYILDILDRKLMGYTSLREEEAKPRTQPMAAFFGPKVMIINEGAGSGGDLLPYLFRQRGIGPVVGTRTWGGTVGSSGAPPQLIDGGISIAPMNGFFDINGKWALEGVGVAPDIEVRDDPRVAIAGGDPQLEAAVREALRLLEPKKSLSGSSSLHRRSGGAGRRISSRSPPEVVQVLQSAVPWSSNRSQGVLEVRLWGCWLIRLVPSQSGCAPLSPSNSNPVAPTHGRPARQGVLTTLTIDWLP